MRWRREDRRFSRKRKPRNVCTCFVGKDGSATVGPCTETEAIDGIPSTVRELWFVVSMWKQVGLDVHGEEH